MHKVHIKNTLYDIKPILEINIKMQLTIHNTSLRADFLNSLFVMNAIKNNIEYKLITKLKILFKIKSHLPIFSI